jgi:3-hydroxybutyryl-CoA dehydrogenase
VGRVAVRINKDLPGFLANRIQHAMMREAFAIIDSGLASAEDVDAAVRYGFGFRYVAAGPIVQKELSGLETQLAAASAIYPSLCNDPEPGPGLRNLVKEGRYGTKTLKGYWTWTEEQARAERARFEAALSAGARLLAASPSQIPG